MKILPLISLAIFSALLFAGAQTLSPMDTASSATTQSFYDLSISGLSEGKLDMADFKGKYILCVNVASKCGYTPQYEPLQALAEQYKDQLVVIGFPCNQFLGQEPGSPEDIASFCQRNYGVSFPMTEKIDVKGKDQHPIYAWLTQQDLNQVADAKVSWNFNKFLISPTGDWLAHFPSKVDPLSEAITDYLK